MVKEEHLDTVKSLIPSVEKELIQLLEKALINESVKDTDDCADGDDVDEVKGTNNVNADAEIPESELPSVIRKI